MTVRDEVEEKTVSDVPHGYYQTVPLTTSLITPSLCTGRSYLVRSAVVSDSDTAGC